MRKTASVDVAMRLATEGAEVDAQDPAHGPFVSGAIQSTLISSPSAV